MKKHPLISAIALITIAAAGLTGCGKKAVTKMVEPVIPVKVIAASQGTVSENSDYAVTVEPVAQSNVAAKIGGKVVSVPVVLGNFVRKGQVLVQLDQTDILNGIRQAEAALVSARANLNMVKAGSRPQQIAMAQSQLNQAKVSYDLAQKNYDRMKSLFDQNLISRAQLEQAEMSLESARAAYKSAQESLSMAKEGATNEQVATAEAGVHSAKVALQSAKSQLPYTSITAPVSGYVTMLNINPGEMASPGLPVVGVADLSSVYAVANVGQSVITAVHEGNKISLLFQSVGGNQQYHGTIRQIARSADPVTKTYKIKIFMNNPGQVLKGGMVGTASFTTRTSSTQSLSIPSDAVIEEDGRNVVYIVKSGRAYPKAVRVGISNNKLTEIVSGLSGGEKIVVSGQHRLQSASKVEVR